MKSFISNIYVIGVLLLKFIGIFFSRLLGGVLVGFVNFYGFLNRVFFILVIIIF